jgi:hypothetical protein
MSATRSLLAAALGLALAGCGAHEAGPSLSFAVEGESLSPSTTLPNAAAQCCCHVRGTVVNTSSIPVHVNLNFQGRDAAGASLGTAIDFVPDIPPGARAPFEAAGITAACARVATLERSHNVTGVFIGTPHSMERPLHKMERRLHS